jgi:DNA-binding NtrC family response regulator
LPSSQKSHCAGSHVQRKDSSFRAPGAPAARARASRLERAQILAEGQVITLDDLPESIVEAAPDAVAEAGDPRHLREVGRRHVRQVFEQEEGNKVRTAKALGISRRALSRLLEKYQLEGPHAEG